MKHSKLFLGATTIVLAVAGVAGANSNYGPHLKAGYYCTKPIFGVGHCVAYSTGFICPPNGVNPTLVCKVALGPISTLYTIYTKINVLNTPCSLGSGCSFPLIYTFD